MSNYKVNALEELTSCTIIIGVDKVIANTASYGGVDEEPDKHLLKRFMLSHSINNYDDRQGIQSALMNNITGVTKYIVYENYTNQTNEKGVPPHSFNTKIFGGDDKKIAEVITKKKIGGCGFYGQIESSFIFKDIPRKVDFGISDNVYERALSQVSIY